MPMVGRSKPRRALTPLGSGVSSLGRIAWAASLTASLAACSADEAPLVDPTPSANAVRVIDLQGETGACETGEDLLNAYCYAKAGGGVEASGVAFRMDSSGVTSASCLTGGRDIRLFCMKR